MQKVGRLKRLPIVLAFNTEPLYRTVQDYSQNILSSVDLSIVYKIARVLDVTLENLVEVLEN